MRKFDGRLLLRWMQIRVRSTTPQTVKYFGVGELQSSFAKAALCVILRSTRRSTQIQSTPGVATSGHIVSDPTAKLLTSKALPFSSRPRLCKRGCLEWFFSIPTGSSPAPVLVVFASPDECPQPQSVGTRSVNFPVVPHPLHRSLKTVSLSRMHASQRVCSFSHSPHPLGSPSALIGV